MVNIKNYLEALDLKEEVRHRGDCPKCKGKNTFTATRDGSALLYNCYKLDCRIKGVVSSGMTAEEIQRRLKGYEEPESEHELFTWPEYIVKPTAEHKHYERFIGRWGLYGEDLMWDVMDYSGQVKWKRYDRTPTVFTRVVGKPSGVVIVVEDVISATVAAKLFPGLTGLAILGTSFSVSNMQHLDNFYKVIVALDPDASYKTLEYKREIEAYTGLETIALRLYDDIKYKVEADIKKLEEIV
jgi:hypothetical protein